MAKDKAAEPAEDAPAKGSKKKLIIIVAVVALLVLGGVYKFVLAKPSAAEAAEAAKPVPGEALPLDPFNINLADGHFLKLGLTLQFTNKATEEETADGSKALDSAITLFSGEEVSVLSVAKNRDKLKAELVHEVAERYEGTVMDIYFTSFVMQ